MLRGVAMALTILDIQLLCPGQEYTFLRSDGRSIRGIFLRAILIESFDQLILLRLPGGDLYLALLAELTLR